MTFYSATAELFYLLLIVLLGAFAVWISTHIIDGMVWCCENLGGALTWLYIKIRYVWPRKR